MQLLMNCYLTQKQVLEITGGVSISILPRSEAWLNESSDHQKALEYVAKRKKMNRYHSMLDFVLCEIIISLRWYCFSFYNGKGKPLRDQVSKKEALDLDQFILDCLKKTYDIFCEERRISWKQFRIEMLEHGLAA